MSLAVAAVWASTASAQFVLSPALTDKEFLNTALTVCVVPKADTRSKFIAAARNRGFPQVGKSAVLSLITLENAKGHLASLQITALKGKPGIFDCIVGSSGKHGNGLRRSLFATLKANYPDTKPFPLVNGWIFNTEGVEYVVATSQNKQLGTTSITVTFGAVNK